MAQEQIFIITHGLDQPADICITEKTLGANEWQAPFYDDDGNPYSDMLLSQAIACGNDDPSECVCAGKLSDPICCAATDLDATK